MFLANTVSCLLLSGFGSMALGAYKIHACMHTLMITCIGT